MKAKTIAKIIAGKHHQWVESIEDESVRKIAEENTIVTGGCIVSLLLGEEVNDFDIYFRTPEAALAVANYYVKVLLKNPPPSFKGGGRSVDISAKIVHDVLRPDERRVKVVVKSAGVAGETEQKNYQYFETLEAGESAQASEEYVSSAVGDEEETFAERVEAVDDIPAGKIDAEKKPGRKKKFSLCFITSNAITLHDQIQLIIRFTGEPDEIHKNYDFVHCTNYWTSWDKKIVLRGEALEAILTKELRYVGSRYPICSIIRTRKFLARGWTINAGQYIKMIWQCHDLDLHDVATLEDQLVGVDSAYFGQLIEALQKAPDPKKIDGTYLMTLIDKIF
jgi:hypothetical protein